METYVYQSEDDHQVAAVVAVTYDGNIHALGLSENGQTQKHWYLDKSDFGLIRDLPKPLMVVWKESISVVPAQFIGVHPPDSEFDTRVTLNDELFLCYKGKNRQHLFQSYFLNAQKASLQYSNLIFFCSINDSLYLTVFEGGKLLFANNFEVKKKEEIIYFTLSVARDCGFDSKPFHLLGDSNEITINELQTEFEKLSIELIHFNREVLHPDFYNAPDPHIAFLLSQMGGCEFPKDYQ